MPIEWPRRLAVDPTGLPGPDDGLVLNRHPWVFRGRSPWVATVREEPVVVQWREAAGVGVVRAIAPAGEDRAGVGGTPPPSETGQVPDALAAAGGPDAPPVLRLVFTSSWTRETATSVATFPEPEGQPTWGPPPEGPDRPVVDWQWGVRMRYRPAPADRPARGVLVHLHGLGGHGLERSVHGPLRDAGWGVLECVYPLANWSRLALDVADPAAREAAGEWLAELIDNRFGELAFAAEAALEALAARGDAAAAAGPVLIASFSAGGNAAPAVAARLGDRVRGLAAVVAGADLMRISVLSHLGDTGLDVRRNGRVRDRRRLLGGELDALSRRYLEQVRLDGWTLAPRLRDVPVLLVLGRFDAVVPVATGQLLRERLGGPETWWILGGHVGAYLSLPWNGPRIARWLLDQASLDPAGVVRPPAASGSAPTRAPSASPREAASVPASGAGP